MPIHMNSLWPLLVGIPIFMAVIWTAKKSIRQDNRQTVLRLMAMTCLLLAIGGLQWRQTSEMKATIFVVDMSQSTEKSREAMQTFIEESLPNRTDQDLVGIVGFGKDQRVEEPVSERVTFDGFRVQIDDQFTNIEQALLQASILLPQDAAKRVVLMTDGYENIGDVNHQIQALKKQGIVVDVYDYKQVSGNEVQLTQVSMPNYTEKDQTVSLSIGIASDVDTKATVKVYEKRRLIATFDADIKEGEQMLTYPVSSEEGGVIDYKVTIEPDEDTYFENNTLSTHTYVNDLPHLLVVQDREMEGENFESMFEGYAMVDTVLASTVPRQVEELLTYDGMIIADVSMDDFPDGFVQTLQTWVGDYKKGLLVIGGDNSYGLGGYMQTPLEELLPVTMDVKDEQEKPSLGMVLVIDKSGSMSAGKYGVSKMELAKEAAIRATEVLLPTDHLGVLGFDGNYKWVLPLEPLEDKANAAKQIGTMRSGGGTTILPSLQEAINVLKKDDSQLRHIILLTDGQAENSGYESALRELNQEGITLSTVGVGEGADRTLLSRLAQSGNGRFYFTDVFSDIPSIFTKEAVLAGKKYLNQVTFQPKVMYQGASLNGITELPPLDGYVATTIKPLATLILEGPEEEPILSSWQYGLGRTMAWTSDMNGRFSSNWLNWENNRRFWINSMSWLMQRQPMMEYAIETSYENGMGHIRLESGESDMVQGEINGSLTAPNGEKGDVILKATRPGIYEGTFESEGEGVYVASLDLGEEEDAPVIAGVDVGYSPEYNFYQRDRITPDQMIVMSGGRLLQDPKIVFEGELPPVKGIVPLEKPLIIIALILFLLEILDRKVRLPEWTRLSWLTRKVAQMLPRKKETSPIRQGTGINQDIQSSQSKDINQSRTQESNQYKQDKKWSKKKGRKQASKKTETVNTDHIDALLKAKEKNKKHY